MVDGFDGGLEVVHAAAPFDLELAGDGLAIGALGRGVPEDVVGGEVLDTGAGDAGGAEGGDDGAQVGGGDAGGVGDGFEMEVSFHGEASLIANMGPLASVDVSGFPGFDGGMSFGRGGGGR